jgi:hypothetical protein
MERIKNKSRKIRKEEAKKKAEMHKGKRCEETKHIDLNS